MASVSHMQARAHTCVGCSLSVAYGAHWHLPRNFLFFLAHGVLPREAFGLIATAASRPGSHDARHSHHDPPRTVTRPPTPLANGPGIRPGSHRRAGPT